MDPTRHCTPGVLPQDGYAILQGAAMRGNPPQASRANARDLNEITTDVTRPRDMDYHVTEPAPTQAGVPRNDEKIRISLETFSGQGWCLVGAGFQFQITDQADTALGMQGSVDVFDGGEDGGEFPLDIGAGGMCFQDELMALEQLDYPGNLLPDRDAIPDRDNL